MRRFSIGIYRGYKLGHGEAELSTSEEDMTVLTVGLESRPVRVVSPPALLLQ